MWLRPLPLEPGSSPTWTAPDAIGTKVLRESQNARLCAPARMVMRLRLSARLCAWHREYERLVTRVPPRTCGSLRWLFCNALREAAGPVAEARPTVDAARILNFLDWRIQKPLATPEAAATFFAGSRAEFWPESPGRR